MPPLLIGSKFLGFCFDAAWLHKAEDAHRAPSHSTASLHPLFFIFSSRTIPRRSPRTMLSACLEFLGLALCVTGSLLVMVACGLPMWKVTAFIDANIVVAQTVWDGLWMTCVVQSTGHMQCKVHDSVLALTQDLQTARALTIISAVLGVVALTVTVAGAQWTNCLKDETVKARVVNAGGVMYIISGLFVLVPLCWLANNIIVNFHDPNVAPSNKREIGAAIYIGWAAAALLLLGGTLLCCSFTQVARGGYPIKYAPTKTITANGEFDKKHYV